MNCRSLAAVLLFWAMLCLAIPRDMRGAPPACTSIVNVDFGNMTINVPEYGPIKLTNGKGGTPKIILDGKDLGSDWEITIDQDITLNPEADVTLRILSVNADHLLGSGAWGYAMMYRCIHGHVRRVFQTVGHLYGIELTKINERTFTIKYGVWLKHDPTCCPSMAATDTYAWFSKEGAFKRVRSEKGPTKGPIIGH